MSADPPPTEGENIASAIYGASKSIDNLVEMLSEKLTPKEETVPERKELAIAPCGAFTIYIGNSNSGTTWQLDNGNSSWKIIAEKMP